MKKPKKKHGPIKSAYELALEKLGQTEADKINAIYQNATPAQKKQIASNLLKMQHSAEGQGKLYIDGKPVADITGIKLHSVKSLDPFAWEDTDYDIQPLDDRGIKMEVVLRFVRLFEAYGLDPEMFVPESEAARTSVAYCVACLKQGLCVMTYRHHVKTEPCADGSVDVSTTFHSKALPKPNGK